MAAVAVDNGVDQVAAVADQVVVLALEVQRQRGDLEPYSSPRLGLVAAVPFPTLAVVIARAANAKSIKGTQFLFVFIV